MHGIAALVGRQRIASGVQPGPSTRALTAVWGQGAAKPVTLAVGAFHSFCWIHLAYTDSHGHPKQAPSFGHECTEFGSKRGFDLGISQPVSTLLEDLGRYKTPNLEGQPTQKRSTGYGSFGPGSYTASHGKSIRAPGVGHEFSVCLFNRGADFGLSQPGSTILEQQGLTLSGSHLASTQATRVGNDFTGSLLSGGVNLGLSQPGPTIPEQQGLHKAPWLEGVLT